MDQLNSFEKLCFGGMAVFAVLLKVLSRPKSSTKQEDMEASEVAHSGSFRNFQRSYLIVYLLMMAADWLQGPYLYALYEDYGYDRTAIGVLFVIGFGSSMLFGTFVGALADLWGRRAMAFVFVYCYSMSCLSKHSPNFIPLAIGRVLGGISTSLLFTVFDTWMIHEHHRHRFPEALLPQTFSKATFGNGMVAMATGVAAQFAASRWGKVSPFDIAIGLLLLGGAVVYWHWPENYGTPPSSTNRTAHSAVWSCLTKPATILCGTLQTLFESCMYTFVLMWTPMLPPDTGYGYVFAGLMAGMMIGSGLFDLSQLSFWSLPSVLAVCCFTSAVSMSIPVLTSEPVFLLLSFYVFEIAVGCYFAAFYSLRSQLVPGAVRATVFNIFRVPLNILVTCICVFSGSWGVNVIFSLCTASQVLALFVCLSLNRYLNSAKSTHMIEMQVNVLNNKLPIKTQVVV